MAECAIDIPQNGREEEEKVGTSSGQGAIHEKGSSSVTSFPPQYDEGSTSYPQPDPGDANYHSDAEDLSKRKRVEIYEDEPIPSEDSESETNAREGERELYNEYRALCAPLLRAAINGNWKDAESFLEQNPDCVGVPITKENATALHVAVSAKRTKFVEELLKLMTPEQLAFRTTSGFTALHSAAQSGIVRIAEMLVKRNSKLPLILDCSGDMPLQVAAYVGHKNMVSYLFDLNTLDTVTVEKRIELLECTSYNEMYDIALKILETASADIEFGRRALEMLAMKPFAISSESQLSFWRGLLKYSGFTRRCYNKAFMETAARELVERIWEKIQISERQLSSCLVHSHITLLFEAAKVGNVEFLNIITRSYPDLLWQLDEDNMSLFHIAVQYRQESVVDLIYETDALKYSLASHITLENKDNILHLAGNLAPFDRLNIAPVGFRLQRELSWFKEIEVIVPPSYKSMKNIHGLTPRKLFKERHKDLQIEAETWMKGTSNICMVVATLIAAIAFAAVFSVPGGNNQGGDNQEEGTPGTPILSGNSWFKFFLISNATALFFSSASILLFLSVFVSRYIEDDFYMSVPSKLFLALATLFVSILGMMVAFSVACILMYNSAKKSVATVFLSAVIIVLVISFSLLSSKVLFFDFALYAYKSRFLFRRPSKRGLFSREMPNGEWINRKIEIEAKRKEREYTKKEKERKGKMLEVPGMLKKEKKGKMSEVPRNVEEGSPRKECELTTFG